MQSSRSKPLKPPLRGKIPVAFPISEGVTVIDFAGPWEVFQDVMIPERGAAMEDQMPFELFTVAEKIETIEGSGGLKLVPDYTFGDAPAAKLVVVPAQQGSPALHEWLKKVSGTTDVTMSVCTGAFQRGRAGLLDGQVRLRTTSSSSASNGSVLDQGPARSAVRRERGNRHCRRPVLRDLSGVARGGALFRARGGATHRRLHGISGDRLDHVADLNGPQRDSRVTLPRS